MKIVQRLTNARNSIPVHFLEIIRKIMTGADELIHSIRFRLAAWFVLVLSLVLVIFSTILYYRQSSDLRRMSETRLEERLQNIQSAIRRYERDTQAPDSVGFIPNPNVGPDNPEPVTLAGYEILVVADNDGNITGAWGPLTDDNMGELVTFSIKSSQSSPGQEPPSPNTSSTRNPTSPSIIDNSISTIDLIDLSGTPMPVDSTRTPGNPENQNSPSNPDIPPSKLEYKGDNGLVYLVRVSPLGGPSQITGYVIVGQPVDPQGDLLRLLWSLIITGLATLGITVAGAFWLADRALQPIQTMIHHAQEISESDLNRRLNLGGRDEISQLANTFDHMLDRLQAAFVRQRQFTADASHELRTPLSIIGLEAERALSPGHSTRDVQHALEIILTENQVMTRLVNELLTLARMDSGQAKLTNENIDLSDVALEVVERYSLLAEQRGIRLIAGDLPEIHILGDRSFLIQMIGNLVDNAMKYTHSGDNNWVRVSTGSVISENGEKLAFVRVSDNGIGIEADYLPHLFDRFFRVDASRTHDNLAADGNQEGNSGSGLGLSIVAWIAQAHNGRVRVESQPGVGTTFTVEMKIDEIDEIEEDDP